MKTTVRQKLLAGFGIVLLIWVVSGLMNIYQFRHIRGHLSDITEVKEPTSAAAFEMEIKLIGTGFGLLGYFYDRDPKHLERMIKNKKDFEKFQATYHELAETEKGKALGTMVTDGYYKLNDLADELIVIEDKQTKDFQIMMSNFNKMDEVLDEKLQPNIEKEKKQSYGFEKMKAVMELEININGIQKWLSNYVKTHNPVLRYLCAFFIDAVRSL